MCVTQGKLMLNFVVYKNSWIQNYLKLFWTYANTQKFYLKTSTDWSRILKHMSNSQQFPLLWITKQELGKNRFLISWFLQIHVLILANYIILSTFTKKCLINSVIQSRYWCRLHDTSKSSFMFRYCHVNLRWTTLYIIFMLI